MGSWFGKKENKHKGPSWIDLNSIEQLEDVIERSKEKPVLVFKHSTRCSISLMVLNGFERSWEDTEEMDLYFLDLLKHRDVSNAIAEKTQVVHQSPQVLVLKDGKVLYHASHNSIDARAARNAVG